MMMIISRRGFANEPVHRSSGILLLNVIPVYSFISQKRAGGD